MALEEYRNYAQFNLLTLEDAPDFEPKKENRFVLVINNIPQIPYTPIPTDIEKENRTKDNLLVSLKSINRPQYTTDPYKIKHYNEEISLPGKTSHNRQITCEFLDYISYRYGGRNNSTATIIYRWYQLIYNVDFGTIGYKDQFIIDADLYLLDPHGKPIEQWRYYNLWPFDVNFNNLSYDSNNICNITVIFQYDKAKMIWVNSAEESDRSLGVYKDNLVENDDKAIIAS